MSKITIKSYRGDYSVSFDDSDIKLQNGPFVLIDSKNQQAVSRDNIQPKFKQCYCD